MPKHKSDDTLFRLACNMGKHLASHPRDAATLEHARKLGIQVEALEAKRLAEADAKVRL